MNWESFHSLRGRFVIVTGTLFLVSSCALASFHFFNSRQSLLLELEKRGRALTENLVVHSEHAIPDADDEGLSAELAETLHDEDLCFVVVQDERGSVVAQAVRDSAALVRARAVFAARSWSPAELDLQSIPSREGPPVYCFSAPVWTAGGDVPARLATVRVGIHTAPTLALIERALGMSLLMCLGMCVAGALATAIVSRWTLMPLRRMAEIAQSVTRGDWSQQVAVRSRDEIGILGEAFNEMTRSLAESMDVLDRRNHELEKTVSEREALYLQSQERATRLSALHEVGTAIASSLDAKEILTRTHDRLRKIIPYDYLVILRRLKDGEGFGRDFVWGGDTPWGGPDPFAGGACSLCREVVRTRKPLAVDTLSGADTVDGRYASAALVPLQSGGEFLGLLALAFTSRRSLSESELDTIAAVAGNVGLMLKNADLFRELQDSYAELKEVQKRLAHSESTRRAEKLRSVGQMASGVAHDFNNVLAAITGRVQLLRLSGRRGGMSPEDVDRSLEVVERAALDGAETVRRIQEISRDRKTEELQKADLNYLVREVVEITRPRWKNQSEERGIRIEVKTELKKVPAVACVPAEIREALTNLIFNAVDAMPAGGTVTICSSINEGGTLLVLSDTGTGIPEKIRDRIFEPFFTTKGNKGSGLGLAMVYGIIQRHGGEMTVRDAEGGGAEFRIQFPPAGQEAQSGVDEFQMTNRPARILVADDEAVVRENLVSILSVLGHEVESAGGGEEILARFEPGNFDFVFTDLGMPDRSGWDVARSIRSRDADIPIVLVTGWGNQISQEESVARGITRVLPKPFTIQKVSSLIAELQGLKLAA